MSRLLELRAALPDPAALPALQARAAALAADGAAACAGVQDVTTFNGDDGLLQLRVPSWAGAHLVSLQPLADGPPGAWVGHRMDTPQPDRLRDLLSVAPGVHQHMQCPVRIHALAGGAWLEIAQPGAGPAHLRLHTALPDDATPSHALSQAAHWWAALGLAAPPPTPAPAFDIPAAPWHVRGSRRLVHDRWLTLRADTCVAPDGTVLDPFYVLEERDWVHVFALDDDGTVPVVRQYRHGARVHTIELPGGIVDEGESPLQAACRELREETGLHATQWHDAGWLHANPARQTNRVHLFLARGLSPAGEQALDPGEQVDVARATPSCIRGWIQDGRWSQSMHVASFLLALRAAARLGWLPPAAACALPCASMARPCPSAAPVAQSSP